MRYPEFLKENGIIGFVSPSFSCGTEPYLSAFNNSLKKWKELGYRTQLGPNTYSVDGIGISNSPKACADELLDSYTGSLNDVLISCGGGELMCEILPYLDFDKINKADPKWYLGYSDNTNFTFLLTTLCDVASIYGPCASSFGMEPWHKSINDTLELLTGNKLIFNNYDLYETESLKSEENPYAPYNCTEEVKVIGYPSDKDINICGRLIGGCLDCLVNLAGTSFDRVKDFIEKYKDDGIIWYLEACDLNVFGIRRAMWELHNAGWFKYAKGFIFGRPANGEEMMNLDRFDAVLPYTRDMYNVPVIMDADIGHRPPSIPLVNGSFAEIKYRNNSLSIKMELK